MNDTMPAQDDHLHADDTIIEIVDMHKWFDEFHVLKDINLKVARKERIVICGPSGSGKSTLIRCINRLEEHQKGQIIVDGIELTNNIKNIEKIRAEVGMVFQHFNLFPHLTIVENLTLGPIWVRKVPRKEAEEAAMHYLEKVQIAEQAKNIRVSFPVDSNNGLRLPAVCVWPRRSCSSMSPHRRLTLK